MRWALVVVVLAAAITGALWKAYDLGAESERAKAQATLAAWKESVIEQANERRAAQQARYEQLQGEFDELRSRPEKVRTVVQRVEVRADDICRSLPAAWKRLWDADADSVRANSEPAAPRLDDGSRVEVAEAAAAVAEARERFESNAAALTALQAYVRAISPKEPEQ